MAANKELHQALENALQKQELNLYYQPQYNLSTSKFEGVEALIRWDHPTLGLLLPSDFIAVAETSDLIVQLGDWVLKTACIQCKNWHEKGLEKITMAVNISARQFKEPLFYKSLLALLNEVELDPQYLEVEITENIIIQANNKHILKNIQSLKSLGVHIALDDFGTGYSSISLLKKIPIDRIKIDKSFIENITTNSDDAAIVKAIVELANSLNLQVIVEGVESFRQLKKLCTNDSPGLSVQGFYFSKPMNAIEVENFLSYHQKNPFSSKR